MKGEVLVEEGVVLSVENGIAEISLTKSDNCEECSARLICKPNKDSSKILKAADPFGVIPGDTVRIEIQGKTLFNVSILLYGVPLVLLVIGILLGLSIFSNYHPTELYSFLFGAVLVVIYYVLTFFKSKSLTKEVLPKIVFVKKMIK